jgi:hypothetical protein
MRRIVGVEHVPTDALAEFSAGRMTKEAAVRALGLHDYAQLLLALGESGLPLPRLPADRIAAMQKTFVSLLEAGVTARCKLIIPDAGPLNSFWVADRLDLLLAAGLPCVLIDAVYDELTGDPVRYQKDREVKAFVDARAGREFILETTWIGQNARSARARGEKVSGRGLGDAAIVQFTADGMQRYLAPGEVAVLLFEDADFRNLHIFRQPDNLHLLSTVGLLRGLEQSGEIASADAVLSAMLTPADPQRQRYARRFTGLPLGTDSQAPGGSRWRRARRVAP